MQGNGDSNLSSISANGRYVVFDSEATNLVNNDTNGNWSDIFVHDRMTGQTTLVSRHTDGTQGNNKSWNPSISADGRFVAFTSNSTNLVSIHTQGTHVFVHDRQTGQTVHVSRRADGTHANVGAGSASISADGRFVVFVSFSDNLVDNDTNRCLDVFVNDLQTGQITRVSRHTTGIQGNGHSERPSISADGRYVAFDSEATNLVDDEANGILQDIFVHDRMMGQTTLVSRHVDGTQGNNESTSPSISADGRFVTFESDADNLVESDVNGTQDVFVHDRMTGQTTLISRHLNGSLGNQQSSSPTISVDGRFVAFTSHASNLVAGDVNGFPDVFLHDRTTEQTTIASRHSGGMQGNGNSGDASISADGRFVAFRSLATTLSDNDTNDAMDVWVYERLSSINRATVQD
jgi:Tol biopolymer transport system component